MTPSLRFQMMLALLIVTSGIVCLLSLAIAKRSFVALPKIHKNTVTPLKIYIENPRLPTVMPNELCKVALVAAGLVKQHFGIKWSALFKWSSVNVLMTDNLHAGRTWADRGI